MIKTLKIILILAVISLAGFGLITNTSSKVAPFLLLLTALMATVIGVIEFQKRKPSSLGLFLAAGFALFVGIYIL
ncbi:DUF3953 domain-containing protein [Sporosarcina trichiuri]|uniref:DUF3953 domain-containing protein n=1 Tax=Sporosarcina trichiuri TaxID=3056445 RepID=UPI0025B5D34F|nr:DUF3953 domain-containing protein [Sporosarcina sp. 0.2-SM1T-5]WJY27332.1 DUF3953 domain-containing protein [Sporosarcina sp. 0.2-SM1T-5]